MEITLAARKSDLARLQAYTVGEALKQQQPDLNIHYKFSTSLGDRNLDQSLASFETRGVFTQDLHNDLVSSKVDLIVHSWKDLPIEENQETFIAATLKREDMRDVLLVKRSKLTAIQQKKQICVATSSPRREHHLSLFLKDYFPYQVDHVNFATLRGNIPTRLSKVLENNDADALLMAKAALDRLLSPCDFQDELSKLHLEIRELLSQYHWMVLPLKLFPTAAAQGALAIETKRDNTQLNTLLAKINQSNDFEVVNSERKEMKAHGGGCHQKIGLNILQTNYGKVKSLSGDKADGTKLSEWSLAPKTSSLPRCESDEHLWPSSPQQAKFFIRTLIDNCDNPETPLWVSRANALPENWNISCEQICWTSGLDTWKQLASRGIWVHGSNESLGEGIGENIATLLGEIPRWTKLSHSAGFPSEDKNILHTYQLSPTSDYEDLSPYTHFYWMSSSAFLLATERQPEILDAYHACGPGNTHTVLSTHISDPKHLELFLNYDSWKESILNR